MQLSQFKSLSIGDRIYAGDTAEIVENVYMRVIDGKPVSYITVEGLHVPESLGTQIFELGPYTHKFENRSKAVAKSEQQAIRELNAQRRNYPESVPVKFIEMSEDVFMGEYEKRQ